MLSFRKYLAHGNFLWLGAYHQNGATHWVDGHPWDLTAVQWVVGTPKNGTCVGWDPNDLMNGFKMAYRSCNDLGVAVCEMAPLGK